MKIGLVLYKVATMLTGRYLRQKCVIADDPLVHSMRMRIILKAGYGRRTLGSGDVWAFFAQDPDVEDHQTESPHEQDLEGGGDFCEEFEEDVHSREHDVA